MKSIDTRSVLAAAESALRDSAEGMLDRLQDLTRVARVVTVAHRPLKRWPQARERLIDAQREDGGWSTTEETLWCVAALQRIGAGGSHVRAGLEWLRGQQSHGGWARSPRELPNYVLTGLVLTLLPELGSEDSLGWLERTWERHLGEDVSLTYKGALFLSSVRAATRSGRCDDLRGRTVRFLKEQQNPDGGFGPWKNHPIGSEPWSTGLCLLAMCCCPEIESQQETNAATDWLGRSQLPSGLWAYHFIDEGSAYAYWGLTEALRVRRAA